MKNYFSEYKWSNIQAMLKNNKAIPAKEHTHIPGKLVVISGATSGIGYETAKLFASHKAHILCINRNKDRSEAVKKEIEETYNVSCDYILADYSDLSQVHRVAQTLKELPTPIDILIHNAGVYRTKRAITGDGFEEVFQVNHLSSFIITYLLKEKLREQQEARILYVNSEGHRFALRGFDTEDLLWEKRIYGGLKSYGSSKTAQLLTMIKFAQYFDQSNVTILAMHPGDVKTNMGENNGPIYRFFKHLLINPTAKDPFLSAQALYYLAVSPHIKGKSGSFFNFTTEEIPAPHALDEETAQKVWDLSIEKGCKI